MKNIKLSIFVLFVAAIFSASAFGQSSESISVDLGDSGTLAKSKLVIKFVKVIEDSRCPADVNCIWAGNAKIEVVVSKGSRSETFTLNTNSADTSAKFANYLIKFTDLKPERTTDGADTKPDEKAQPCGVPYKALFSVEKSSGK